jgi:hypothetical protein
LLLADTVLTVSHSGPEFDKLIPLIEDIVLDFDLPPANVTG